MISLEGNGGQMGGNSARLRSRDHAIEIVENLGLLLLISNSASSIVSRTSSTSSTIDQCAETVRRQRHLPVSPFDPGSAQNFFFSTFCTIVTPLDVLLNA